jgi:hypothetical protein
LREQDEVDRVDHTVDCLHVSDDHVDGAVEDHAGVDDGDVVVPALKRRSGAGRGRDHARGQEPAGNDVVQQDVGQVLGGE